MRIAFGAALSIVMAFPLFAQRPALSTGPVDISGMWNFATLTPLERPPEFADKYFLTPTEAAEFEAQRRRVGDQVFGVGPAVDEIWLERGSAAKIHEQHVSSLITDPANGHMPAPTAEAQARLGFRAFAMNRSAGPEDRMLSERCLRSASGPPMFPSADANLVQIVQSATYVAIIVEKFHDARIIPVDGRPHLRDTLRSYSGDARGKWEGSTLVIDTLNFSHKIGLTGRFDGNLHLTERFTRTAPDSLLYQVTIDDPTAFVTPWSVTIPMRRTTERTYEFACHEGNYSLPNILRAARLDQQ